MQSPYVCYKYEMLQIDVKQKGKQNLSNVRVYALLFKQTFYKKRELLNNFMAAYTLDMLVFRKQ